MYHKGNFCFWDCPIYTSENFKWLDGRYNWEQLTGLVISFLFVRVTSQLCWFCLSHTALPFLPDVTDRASYLPSLLFRPLFELKVRQFSFGANGFPVASLWCMLFCLEPSLVFPIKGKPVTIRACITSINHTVLICFVSVLRPQHRCLAWVFGHRLHHSPEPEAMAALIFTLYFPEAINTPL